MVRKITENDFDKEIKEGKIVIDFYADWCGPCKMLSPIVDEVSEEINDIRFLKINVDEAEEISQRYGVMSIPTLIIFENGEVIKKNVGLLSKDELIKFIGE